METALCVCSDAFRAYRQWVCMGQSSDAELPSVCACRLKRPWRRSWRGMLSCKAEWRRSPSERIRKMCTQCTGEHCSPHRSVPYCSHMRWHDAVPAASPAGKGLSKTDCQGVTQEVVAGAVLHRPETCSGSAESACVLVDAGRLRSGT